MPYYSSERCFRDYEAFIAKAVGTLPTPFRIYAPDLNKSANTVAARLRDAIRYYDKQRPDSDLIDPVSFDRLVDSIEVSQPPDEAEVVLVRLRRRSKPATDASVSDPLWPQAVTPAVLTAVATLITEGAAPNGVRLTNVPADLEQAIYELERQHDIAVRPLPNGGFLLI